MRNIVLLISTFSLVLFSCKKDDDTPISDKEMIIGSWTFTKVYTFDERTNTTHLVDEVPPCSGERDWVLKSDGSFSLDVYYENSNGDCELTKSRIGNYSYDELTKKLVLNYVSNSPETFSVYKLTDAEMWINLGKIDTDNDEDIVYHILVFNK